VNEEGLALDRSVSENEARSRTVASSLFTSMFRKKLIAGYLLLVGLPLLALFMVLQAGAGLSAPAMASIRTGASGSTQPAAMNLFLLVLQIAVILLASRGVGMLFKRIKQPQVIGEMVAGILLGPSLLGWAAPWVSNALFPATSLGYLNAVSQIGLVFFMFLVGIAINPQELRGHGHAAILTSNAGIVMPFFLGTALALFLYPRLATAGVSFMTYALFMGSAMSITAFPVLARILTERNLLRSRMGTLAISCAAVDDITGWCILAYIVVLVRSASSSKPFWVTVAGALVFVLVMFAGVKRALRGFETSFHRNGRLTDNSLALMLVLGLFSALTTEWLGIHSLFGAFFMGAIMPKSRDFVKAVLGKLESLTVVAFLPLFFAFSGLRTSVGMVHGQLWVYTLLVIIVAITGKFGGSMAAARMAGVPWRDATALGILMNTRGLMELIALNIGLDIGVISQTVFTIMVLMALVTTFMTSPLLEWVYPAKLMLVEEDVEAA
jgi:Kef-type K+ transport system membrane component KefB